MRRALLRAALVLAAALPVVPAVPSRCPASVRSARKRLVVAFSTGHAGTTTLRTLSVYGPGACRAPREVKFLFEQGGGNGLASALTGKSYRGERIHCALRHWYAGDAGSNATRAAEREARIVRERYLPTWRAGDLAVLVGHDNLLFYRGIADVLGDAALFVRIRRDRYETAASFAASFEDSRLDPGGDMCPTKMTVACAFYIYCPTEQPGSIILEVAPRTWRNLTGFQRALWFADEVEARWQSLLASDARVDYVELAWSKATDTFPTMEAQFAALLGLGLSENAARISEKPHVNASKNAPDDATRAAWAAEDASYVAQTGLPPALRDAVLVRPYASLVLPS